MPSRNGHTPAVAPTTAPFSEEAEQATIGAVLVNPETFLAVRQFLAPDDFFLLRHRSVWEALDRLSGRGDTIDYLTVMEELRATRRLDDIGGPAYLTELSSAMPSSQHAEIYGRIVERAAIRRRYLAAADEIRALALDEDIPVEQVEAGASARILTAQGMAGTSFVTMRTALGRHFENVETAMNQPKSLIGIPSSLRSLNGYLNGYRRGRLYVCAGRPGMGKSSFLYTEAAHMAANGHPALFVSLEVGEDELMDAFVAGRLHIAPDRMAKGELEAHEWDRYVVTVPKMQEWPLVIDDTPGLTPAQLRLKAMRLRHEMGIAAVFVDYIQLMSGGREQRYDNRTQEVGYISRSLKRLAKELNVPVIAAAQLSRSVEQRADKHPLMSDLRESGDIENDADVVMMFYRHDYYARTMPAPPVSETEIGIVKHRGGAPGMAYAGLMGECKKFVELERQRHEVRP